MTSIAQKQQSFSLSNYNSEKSISNFNAAKNKLPTEITVIADRRGNEGEKSIEHIRAQNAQAQGKVKICKSNTPYEKMSVEKIGTTFEQEIEKPRIKNLISFISYLVEERDPSREQGDKLQDGLVKFIKSIEKIRADLKNVKKCEAISEIKKFYVQVDTLRSDAEKIGKDLGVCMGTREECLPKKKAETYPSQSI